MARLRASFFFLLMLVLSRSEDAEESHSAQRTPSESSQRNTSGNPALRELLEGLISSTMSSSSPENQDLGPQISGLRQDDVDDENLPPEFVDEDKDLFDVSLDESLFELLNLSGNESRNKRKVNTDISRNPQHIIDPNLFSQFRGPLQPDHLRRINSLSSRIQTRRLENDSMSVFSFDDGNAMMKMIKGMPREFKLRFIALLVRSDRRGLQDFLREVIAGHMRSGKDDDALQSNAVGGKVSHDMETARGAGKSLQSSRLANGHQNEADLRLMSSRSFSSRQGSPAILPSENLMSPNIQSAVILHRETISEPGKILKIIRRQKSKSITPLPSFHPNTELKAVRNRPVAVPEPAKLHHFIRQSSASGRPNSGANRVRTTIDPFVLSKNNAGKSNDASSISSSDLSFMLERIRNTPAFTSIVNNIMELLQSDDGRTKLSSMPAFSNSGKSLLSPSSNHNKDFGDRPTNKVNGSTQKLAKNAVGVPLPRPGNLDTRIAVNAARQPPPLLNNDQLPKSTSTQQGRQLQNTGAQSGSELSTIENHLRSALNKQIFSIGSSENDGPFQQNRFVSSQPDFSQEIIGFSRTAFNPSPVLTVQPQTIVPLSTDIEGQLFDEAIENFKDETEGSSITTGNFLDEDSDFNSGVLNFVPLSTDIKGQLTDVPKITANEPQQITGQVLTNSGVPLPIGQTVNSAQAAGPGGFALALADFSQTGQTSPAPSTQTPNSPGASNSVGVPLPSTNSAPQNTFRNPLTIADILRSQSGDSFDLTLQKATDSALQTAGVPLTQNTENGPTSSLFSRDESLPGKSLSFSTQENVDFNSPPVTDIFGNPIGIPLPGLQVTSPTSNFPSEQSNFGQNGEAVGVPLPTVEPSFNSGSQNFPNSFPQTDIFGNIINIPLDQLQGSNFNDQQLLTDSFDSQNVGVPLPTSNVDNVSTNDNTVQQTDIFGNVINIPLSDLENVRFLSSSEEILPGNIGVALPPFSRNFTSSGASLTVNNQGDVFGQSVGVPLPTLENVLDNGQQPKSAPTQQGRLELQNTGAQLGSELSTVQNLPKSQNSADVGVPLPDVSSNFNVFESPSDQEESHDQFSFLSSLTVSRESIEADDSFIGPGFSSQPTSNLGGYDVIDEKGYPPHSKKHKLVTFFSSGLLLPFAEREVMYKKEKEKSPQYVREPPQPPKYSHHFRVYKEGEDYSHLNKNNEANPRAPSLTYTVPPFLDSTYAARSLPCQSQTVVTTSVVLVDLPASVTTLTELSTAVQMVKSFYVTPVVVAQTYTALRLNTVAQYQATRDSDYRQNDFREPTTVQRLPGISLLVPSSQFNAVDTETGAKKTYALSTVRRKRSPDFGNDASLVHELSGLEVPNNGSQRVPFIVNHTVRIGKPAAEPPTAAVNHLASAAQQPQAVVAHQDLILAAHQHYSPPLHQNYVAPIQSEYSLPIQNEPALPVQNEFTPQVQNEYEYIPPVQNEYTPPVQNEYGLPLYYTPPVQNGYIPPVQNEYTLPLQNEYAPPVINEYIPPIQNEYTLPIQKEFTAPALQQYNFPQQNYAQPLQNEYIPPARSLYAPSSTVIVTTVLRTMTSLVPRTLVATNYRVSTLNLGQTASTIRSTSVYCLQPEQRRGQYNQYKPPVQLHSATPPLPISAHNTKYDHVPTAFVRPTPKLKSDPSSYQTWVGAIFDNGNGYSSQHDSDLPSKFILLQNTKPRGFVVEDGSKNGGLRVKLSHDEGKYGGVLNRKLNLDSVTDSDIERALSDTKLSNQRSQGR